MKEIKIDRLHLVNFKCHRNLWVILSGNNAGIYGDNATGKSSVYDALTWLLFDKDASGNGSKNIEVKPLNETGEVRDHDAITTVEAVLLVDGVRTTYRRDYKEVWSTKRGSTQATYDGNQSEYFVDGEPVKKNVFQDRVSELVSEEQFRMLTSVTRFANEINWQERRAVLFDVAGVQSDAQIMTSNPSFEPLLAGMGRMNLDGYKKKLLNEKKQYVGVKNELPARINECQKTIEDIETIDFEAARSELEVLQARKDSLNVELLKLDNNTAMDAKRNEITQANFDMTDLEIANRRYRESQKSNISNIVALKNDVSNRERNLDFVKKQVANEKVYIEDLEGKIAESRSRWIATNAETFTGGSCPTCGQVLPENQYRIAQERFDTNKKYRLAEIENTANAYKTSKAAAEERLANRNEEVIKMEAELFAKQAELKEAEANKVEIVDIEGYADKMKTIETKIQSLQSELAGMASSVSVIKINLKKQIAEVDANIRAAMDLISKESVLEYTRNRVEELREDARKSAEGLEAIEQMLYLIEEYSRYKTRYVEDSINGLFRIARFRLFREQANGGIEDRCDVVHDGVPYISVNNGMKINLGIDIINTLSKAYGVSVPLFIDNAESVTNLETCSSQVIRLVVSEKDKELRIEYEN